MKNTGNNFSDYFYSFFSILKNTLVNLKKTLAKSWYIFSSRAYRWIRNFAVKHFAKGPLSDKEKIISTKGDFFFAELAERAEQSPEGYAHTYLEFPYLPFLKTHFFVFTGENLVREAITYGDHIPNPLYFDANARIPFSPLEEFLEMRTLITQNGPEVRRERQVLKEFISAHEDTLKTVDNEFSSTVRNWSNAQSINESIQKPCVNIVAKIMFNINKLPQQIYPLIRKAEEVIFNYDNVDPETFYELKMLIKEMNIDYLNQHHRQIFSANSYLNYLRNGNNNFTHLNPLGGLIVEGNLTAALTGVVLQLATSPELQNKLRSELLSLNGLEINSVRHFTTLKNLKLLHYIYLETLRYFAPAGPIARYVSKPTTIGGINIPKGSYLFIPLRHLLYNPKIWSNPHQFDPMRHQQNPQSLNTFNFAPFGFGPRVCPASTGFIESIIKIALYRIFANRRLLLISPSTLEIIPSGAKQARLHDNYYGSLEVLKRPRRAMAVPKTLMESEQNKITPTKQAKPFLPLQKVQEKKQRPQRINAVNITPANMRLRLH